MLIKLTEVCTNGAYTTHQQYSLREVFVNPEHVVMIREEKRLRKLNEEGQLDPELNPSHFSTKLTINRGQSGTDIVVVGSPDAIESQLNENSKKLLRG